jgi:hypothetical protein
LGRKPGRRCAGWLGRFFRNRPVRAAGESTGFRLPPAFLFPASSPTRIALQYSCRAPLAC